MRGSRHWAVGLPLGLAFQLADDLLDVVGSSSNTGKPVGGDIREGKRTVLLARRHQRGEQTRSGESSSTCGRPIRVPKLK